MAYRPTKLFLYKVRAVASNEELPREVDVELPLDSNNADPGEFISALRKEIAKVMKNPEILDSHHCGEATPAHRVLVSG